MIAIADCTGHGVPGAFMSIIGNNLLDEIVINQHTLNASEILNKLNHGIIKVLKRSHTGKFGNTDGMDISVCVYNKSQKTIELSLANHWAILAHHGKFEKIEGEPVSIGSIFSKQSRESFKNHIFQKNGAHSLYLFSDGYYDQFVGPRNTKFMQSRFFQLITEIQTFPMDRQKEILFEKFEAWKGENRQIDDVLIMGITF